MRCFLSSIILVRYLTTLSDTQKTHHLPQYWDSHKPASFSRAQLNSRHPNPSNTCTSTEVIRGILRTFQRPCTFFLSVFLRRHSAQIFRQEAAHSAGSRVPQRQVWPWNSQLQMNKHCVDAVWATTVSLSLPVHRMQGHLTFYPFSLLRLRVYLLFHEHCSSKQLA